MTTIKFDLEDMKDADSINEWFSSAFDSSSSGANEYEDSGSPNVYLIVAFLFGFIGFLLAFKYYEKVQPVIAAILSALAAAMLCMFRATFIETYQLQEVENYITLKFEWGWVVSLVCFIVAALGLIGLAVANSNAYNSANKAHVVEQQSALLSRVCPYCRQNILANQRFCTFCGRETKRDCPFCGAENLVEARICVNCGKEFPYGVKHDSVTVDRSSENNNGPTDR